MHLVVKLVFMIFLTANFNPMFAAGGDRKEIICPEFPYFRPRTGPLALVNCDFHKVYEKRVEQMMRSFGAPGGRAVILNLGGRLVLKSNGKTETIDIATTAYQQVKVFAHASFAVFLLLSQQSPGQLTSQTRSNLQILKQHLQQAATWISSIRISIKDKEAVSKLANLTEDMIKEVLANGHWTAPELDVYFKKVKPLIFTITKIAAQLEIAALDKAINPWLAQIPPEEQRKIGIVVATAHQARAKEISLQYFAHKFGQQFGEGALLEDGMVVLEDKFDENSALKLLARHYLDRDAGQVMFNDPSRLQRDVLGDESAALMH